MSEIVHGATITNSFEKHKILIEDILLWHDNPRNVTQIGVERPLSVLSKVDGMVYEQLLSEGEIGQLVKRILAQGWQDNGDMLVGYYPKDKKYFVLEGNRRITALRVILEDIKMGYDKCQRYPSSINIQDFYKEFLKDGITCWVAHSELTNDPSIKHPGDASTWTEDTWVAIKQWISNIHQTGKKEWGLEARSVDTFNTYMNELHKEDPNIDVTRMEDFYLDQDVLATLADRMGESRNSLKIKLHTITLTNQVSNKIQEMGGELPEKGVAAIFTEGLLPQKKMRERFGFNTQREGRLYEGEYLEKFISLFFDVGDTSEKVIRQISAGESNSRDYNHVLINDRTENEDYIKMIEEDGEPASHVKALLKIVNEDYKVLDILALINKKLGDPRIKDLTAANLESDRLLELIDKCTTKFDRLKNLLDEARENE